MRNVFITGASRGIGFGFVRHYLTQGARVFAACRTPQQASHLHTLSDQYRERLVLVAMDVTDQTSINAAYNAVRQQTEALDLIINNAGIFHKSQNLGEVIAEGLCESFAVNTIAPLLVAQSFVDLLQAGNSPKLINITMPTPPISKSTRLDNHAYIASRYALNALTRMLALELVGKGIITAALYPGYLQTDMNQYAAEAKPVEEGIPLAAGVIDALTMEQNGFCFLPNGNVYEW